MGPDSISRGMGDAPSGHLDRVFDDTVTTIDALMLQSWSLIVVDWKLNREVHSIVDDYLAELRVKQGDTRSSEHPATP